MGEEIMDTPPDEQGEPDPIREGGTGLEDEGTGETATADETASVDKDEDTAADDQ